MEQTVNPQMIVLARETRGFTQKELADKLQVTQGKISKIESGLLPRAADELVDELARVLKYPPKFFYQTSNIYPTGMHLYRKHRTLPAKLLVVISAMMNIFRLHIKGLLDAAEIEYKPVPECDLDEYGSPADVARVVRQYLHLPRGPIKNMTKVLECMGVVVIPYNAGTNKFSGASMLTEKPNYIVVVNAGMPGDRYRFTLAHELGHLVMHRLPTPDMEEEADRFASEFLMPAHEIEQHLSKLNLAQLANLKKYWKVSMAALLKHAHVLGKISDRQYRTLWTQISSAGWRLREPSELDIPVEQPTLLAELLEFHFKDLGLSPEKLSDKLAYDPDEFAALYLPSKRLKLVSKTG